MIFEIDDAGTGDLIGDAIIGFYIPEKEQYLFKNIPVKYYQEPLWQKKCPDNYTVVLVRDGLKELGFDPKNDKVRICQGNIFDETRKMLKDEGIKFENWAIDGNLQTKVEGEFLNHLKTIGVHSKNLSIESGKKRYFQLFGWVSYDFPKRRKYVKSGFKAWQNKWEKQCMEEYQKRKKKREKMQDSKRPYSNKNYPKKQYPRKKQSNNTASKTFY